MLLCRLSRRRLIDGDEMRAIARRRASRISWSSNHVIANLERNYWTRGGGFYLRGEYREHKLWTGYEAMLEAIREGRPWMDIDTAVAKKTWLLYRESSKRLAQTRRLVKQLRKEIRNEQHAA